LEVGLRHCGLVHRERRTRRDSIKREAFFITGSSAIQVGALPYPRGKGIKTDTKAPPPSRSRSARVQLYITSMEGVMSKILRSMAVLVLAFVGLGGCDYEPRAVGDTNPARVAEMK